MNYTELHPIPGMAPAGPPWLLKATVFSVMAIPPYLVVEPIGASANLPEMLALGLFGLWLLSTVLRLHDPVVFRHPGRAAVLLLLFASCVSYAHLFAGLSGASTVAGRAAADRWILLMFAAAGIAFVTTETVRTLKDARVLVRWVLAGGTVCCLVAIIQFALHTNPVDWMKPIMVGFTDNNSGISFQERASLMRVSGTTMHPIELGVVSAMLLPLAVWRALYDRQGWKRLHWVVVALFILTNAMTVSRSALIGLVIAMVVTVPFLPRTAKRWSLVLLPFGAAGLFVGVPGLLGTLFNTSTAGSSDSSITYRTEDYPLVLRMVADRPWFGTGPGTWMPVRAIDVLDNQYLLVAVTMGVIGLVGLIAYLLVPALAALAAARGARDGELGLLAAAAAAAGFIATVASGTFDSLSFQVFALLLPFFIGLSGASWLMVKNQLDPRRTEPSRADAGKVPWG
ncbi:O-antigen ligase family protein [Arthrobacter sp. B10-11]|uniref:O-antigen ligase family protein n=1 Tax=Arthrobacter sp. B10-11 TaxID=3081160 RepID=UPI0029557B2A|nr:O-antigen ligase family protein [Arthrobacter sp. B10-11]MDV8149805.1 O-antigen ligase family protein [Arthrobacter sp. B10-11]